MSVELRIRLTKGNIYAVQRKVPFLKRWHRWKTIYETRNYADALVFKTVFVPKDVFENSQMPKT